MNYNQSNSSVPMTNSTTALISLLAGIAGLTLIPFLGSIVAVITGHMAKKEIRESMGRMAGDGMATIGLILGYLGLIGGLIGICLSILVFLGVFTVPFCMIPFFDTSYFFAPVLLF